MISEKIKDFRLYFKLTQKELAQKIGSTAKNIWAYENNVATPPIDVLINLSNFFRCSIDYLIGREDDFGNITIVSPTASTLSEKEKELLEIFKRMPKESKETALDIMHSLAGDKKTGSIALNKRA